MRRIKWWEFLRFLGLEFWLPLPILGLAFWLVSGLATEHNLKLANRSVDSFKISPDSAQPSNKILYIKVTINRDRNFSQVQVKQATQVYQKREFQLPTTELEQVETAISEKYSLSSEKVRQLLRYQYYDN
jgi:hypothetical protein